jgi:cation transport ATPase
MSAINFQQSARTAAPSNQTAERPEQPERPERPEAVEHATVLTGQQLGDQIREEVRQSIQNATRAVAESRVAQQEVQQALRDAQQHVRDAEQQVRDARTADQRGAAQQELSGAQTELRALQSGLAMAHTVQTPMLPRDMVPPQAVYISIAFFVMIAVIIVGWPLARALGRRLERRGDMPGTDPALAGQLQRIEQAVEAMSIEIERISESQRFMAKLQSGAPVERSALETGERR